MSDRLARRGSDLYLFENPLNGYQEGVPENAGLWMLLFGVIYMIVRGLWTHVAVVAVLIMLTMATPWLGVLIAIPTWITYSLKARDLIKASYLRRGWREIGYDDEQPVLLREAADA